jgi:hypothetical protein
VAVTPSVDYYRVLQVDPDAEPEVIAAAYRKLAAKYHPDVNPSAEAAERMREINVAYDVLGDAARRAEYDRARGARWAPRFGSAPTAPAAPSSTLEQLGRTLLWMLVSSVVFSLVARMLAGTQGMTIALLIILVVVLWKGPAIMRYFGRR